MYGDNRFSLTALITLIGGNGEFWEQYARAREAE